MTSNLLKWVVVCMAGIGHSQIIICQEGVGEAEIRKILIEESKKESIASQDIFEFYISDHYTSQDVTHIYLHQSIDDIPIYGSQMNLHGSGNQWFSYFNIYRSKEHWQINDAEPHSLLELVQQLSLSKSYDLETSVKITEEAKPGSTEIKFVAEAISDVPVIGRLCYFEYGKLQFRKAWQFVLEEKTTGNWKQYLVDAINGELLEEIDLTLTCSHGLECGHTHHMENSTSVMTDSSYNVHHWPLESPHDGGRQIMSKPWQDNSSASPEGWHKIGNSSFQHTKGNNVDAYEDSDDSNGPTGGNMARADGGADLNFDFAWDPNGNLADYKDAAVTNLFYWNNICHDVWYNYGFDEASGNFQSINYSNSGAGGDFVRAEAQDGGGTCNANFSTPPDGVLPRMQMYNCSGTGFDRDGSFDNLVIVHEYGHGISIRLTGGPSASGCLGNVEQMGEGWSDYFGAVMTIKTTDVGMDSRGVGKWLFGQGPNGPGIRPYPYSTDMTVNPMTYDVIKQNGISVPHGIGSVWATMLWEMTWELIDEYGFDPDIYNGSGGNNIAMKLVIEGLKIQPCSPGFVDGRDAILAADQLLYNGANQCLIWEAFAKRGLGYSAHQGLSTSRMDGTEAFDLPPECSIETSMYSVQDWSFPTDKIEYRIKVKNHFDTDVLGISLQSYVPDSTSFLMAYDGAIENNGEIIWPIFDLLVGDSIEYSFEVQVDSSKSTDHYDIMDDVENGSGKWDLTQSGSTEFVVQANQANSGTQAFFASDESTSGEAMLTLKDSISIDTNTILSFVHFYNTEFTWDGGRVFLTIDGEKEWIDLGPYFIQNGYNSIIFNSIPGFSGNSGGFITSIVDLSSFSGKSGKIRFQMSCDAYVGGVGWYIDDIEIQNTHHFVDNKALVSYGTNEYIAHVDTVCFIKNFDSLSLSFNVFDVSCGETNNGIVDLHVSGGTGNYVYQWSNGQNTQDLIGVEGGTYIVSVTTGISTTIDSVHVLGGYESMVKDPMDYGGTESLRFLIETNACPGDTIYFDHSMIGDTIQLDQKIIISNNFTLRGQGNNMVINAQGNNIHFDVEQGNALYLSEMKLINGEQLINGGAIHNKGHLVLDNIVLEGNTENGVPKAMTNNGTIDVKGNVEIK